jgi:hypothetical protein
MIGIRYHNPDSLTFDCRPWSTTLPVRVYYQETPRDSRLPTVRTSARHPRQTNIAVRSAWHPLAVDIIRRPETTPTPHKFQLSPYWISTNQSFPRRDP